MCTPEVTVITTASTCLLSNKASYSLLINNPASWQNLRCSTSPLYTITHRLT